MNKKILAFEGLRGFAALSVVVYHFFRLLTPYLEAKYYIYPHDNSSIAFLKNGLFLSGYTLLDGKLAVIIFWILSSFVICAKLFQKNENTQTYLLKSTVKRYFRLAIPCVISVFIAYFLLLSHLYYNGALSLQLSKSGIDYSSLATLVSSETNAILMLKSAFWETFFHFNDTTCYNTVLWTMEKEFYGSIFCFAVFGIFGKSNKRFIIYSLLIVLFIFLNIYWLICFLSGMILSDLYYSEKNQSVFIFFNSTQELLKKWNISFFLFFLFIIFIVKSITILTIPLAYAYVNTIFGFCIVFFTLLNPALNNFFSRRIFIWLGKHSFSMYLIHMLFINSIISFIMLRFSTFKYIEFISFGILLLFVFLFSPPFTKFIDVKAIKYSNKIGDWFVKEQN